MVGVLALELLELLAVVFEVVEAVPVLAREGLQGLILLSNKRPELWQLNLAVSEPFSGVGVDLRVEALDSFQLCLNRKVDLRKLVDLQ